MIFGAKDFDPANENIFLNAIASSLSSKEQHSNQAKMEDKVIDITKINDEVVAVQVASLGVFFYF